MYGWYHGCCVCLMFSKRIVWLRFHENASLDCLLLNVNINRLILIIQHRSIGYFFLKGIRCLFFIHSISFGFFPCRLFYTLLGTINEITVANKSSHNCFCTTFHHFWAEVYFTERRQNMFQQLNNKIQLSNSNVNSFEHWKVACLKLIFKSKFKN